MTQPPTHPPTHPPTSSQRRSNRGSSCQRTQCRSQLLLTPPTHPPTHPPPFPNNREGAIEALHANELSVVLNFFSRGGSVPSMLLTRLLAASYKRLPLYGPPSLATTAFSLSRLPASPPPVAFLDGLRDHAQPLLPAFNPQELANILLAFARLTYHPGTPFLAAVAGQILVLLSRFTPQGLCNTCNAWAKLAFDPGR